MTVTFRESALIVSERSVSKSREMHNGGYLIGNIVNIIHLYNYRLLAESLGYREDSTDCTVPCTPPRTEEDIYNNFDADFLPKKENTGVQGHPLLKEILFKEEPRSVANSNGSSPSPSSSSSSSSNSSEFENSSALRELLFKGSRKELVEIPKTNQPKVERSLEEVVHSLRKEEQLFKDGQKSDHQLLREVLRDTSFQRKYNLRPVDLGGVGTGFVEDMETSECVGDLAREQLEPVLSLAIQQLQKDFDNTCVALDIHPGKTIPLIRITLISSLLKSHVVLCKCVS